MSSQPIRIVSLGAGVQSTTMLLMGLEGAFGEKPDAAIFADTRWEPEEVYEHLERLRRTVAPSPIVVGSRGDLRKIALEAVTTRSGRRMRRVSLPVYVAMPKDDPLQQTLWDIQPAYRAGTLKRQCTGDFKIAVVKKEVRKLLGVGPRAHVPAGSVEQWIGISTDEADRMASSGVAYIRNRHPLIEAGMSRDDCEAWLQEFWCDRYGFPMPPKSACIGCPFTSDARWAEMRRERPEEFENAAAFDEAIREGLECVEHPVYLHRSLVPLREVEFDPSDTSSGFTNECNGMCGV